MNDMTLEEILNEALLDEYRARDTYRKISEPQCTSLGARSGTSGNTDSLDPVHQSLDD